MRITLFWCKGSKTCKHQCSQLLSQLDGKAKQINKMRNTIYVFYLH